MQALIDMLGSTIGVVAPFLVVLGVVIFVHEFGHYIVGRWCGIGADVFSLGFGGEAFGWTDKRGTRWRLSWIPLGGYVQFRGDAGAASTEPDQEVIAKLSESERRTTFFGAPLWARAATVAAGPLANFLLTIVMIAGLGLAMGRPSDAPVLGEVAVDGQAAEAGFQAGDRLISVEGAPIESFSGFANAMNARQGEATEVVVERDGRRETLTALFTRPALVNAVAPGTPAERAGLEPGDLIMAVNGAPIVSFEELRSAVRGSGGASVALTIDRGGEEISTTLTPELRETPDPRTGLVERVMMIGVVANFNIGYAPTYRAVGPLEAIGLGIGVVGQVATGTFGYFGAWIAGDADGSSLSGPLGIAHASGQAAQGGLVQYVGFIATVSAAIGLLNLFPIPVLDGGHLLFYGVEAVRGKPLSARMTEAAALVGLAAILVLVVFSTGNDLGRYEWWNALGEFVSETLFGVSS